jgi:head-tail adaptor
MFKLIRPDTAIRIKKNVEPQLKDADGFRIDNLVDVIDADILVEWQNKFGSEVYAAAAMNAIEPATLRLWYIPGITADCKIVRLEDGAVFDIVGTPDDVKNNHQFLQIEVKRYVKGR